jgi:hypothetical protein
MNRNDTFVLHAPLKLHNHRFPCQIVQEWLGVYWNCLQSHQPSLDIHNHCYDSSKCKNKIRNETILAVWFLCFLWNPKTVVITAKTEDDKGRNNRTKLYKIQNGERAYRHSWITKSNTSTSDANSSSREAASRNLKTWNDTTCSHGGLFRVLMQRPHEHQTLTF